MECGNSFAVITAEEPTGEPPFLGGGGGGRGYHIEISERVSRT